MKLKNAVALITGSSSGIGAATARLFAEQGCHVVINYSRNEEGARAVAKDCEAFGVRTLVQQADVSDDTQCQTLVEATLAEFGRLDVLVNNAGTTKFCAHQDLDGLSKDDFLHLYAVNTVGPYQMTRAAEKALRQAGTAQVINMASIAGLAGVGSSIAYAASKGALLTMTKSLARVLGPEIRVNAICPYYTRTPMLEGGEGLASGGEAEQTLAMMAAGSPMKRIGEPEEIVAVMLMLLSPANTYMNGQAIAVDGGVSAF
ncbi:MAG TPA: oxidoreductase [Alcanivorax sp.]|nr:oxidoreductase [Alcanivorax sp.]